MRVLVTGGAGYIGAVTAQDLLQRGYEVCILDDLSTGHAQALPPEASFVEGRVQDAPALQAALDGCEAVIHFASLSLVGESVRQPLHYFRENLGSALSLLEGMAQVGVSRLVFSSSAAVYGEPAVELIDEDCACEPVNPYGMTKLMIERMLAEEARARGLSAIALRYFNACGAHDHWGEDHEPETHVIPRLCGALLGERDDFKIFGDDYDTPDGTAVRDYIHVLDLASAHALALGALGEAGFEAINLGTGLGASVREVVEAARAVSGIDFHPQVGSRREGDPPRLVASHARAAQRLGWTPEHSSLERILGDAWAWHLAHPRGYPQS